jgi:ribosome-binding ATPase YchF (GTP1/OBG family)
MAATITFRPDDDARLALEELTSDGTPVSRAVRDALVAAAARHAKSRLRAEAEALAADPELQTRLADLVAPADAVFLNAKLEMDLMDMEPDEALELLQSFGAEESGLDQLARKGFHTLGLQTYLTAGPKEARAWTIGKGWTAPQAAGVIHTDFQRGFIKAEVVSFADLVAAGSMAAAKAAGRVRIEGKDYVMADGDVVEFRFNV